MEERLSCFIWSGTMSDRLEDRLLWTPCQALAERMLNEPDKDLIATFQPEQHAHEIKLNVISAPSQIKHTVKGSVWKCSIKKMPCCYSSTALPWAIWFFKPLFILKSSGKMTGGSSVPRTLGYGPAEEARLGQTRRGTDPKSWGKQSAMAGGSSWGCTQPLRADPSTFLQLVTSPGRKAKTRLKSANTGFVMNQAASFDCSCLHLKEKRVPKNVKEVNNFSFWCKNGTVFQNSCLNTDINLNKKKELEDFILKYARKRICDRCRYEHLK